MKEIQLHSFKQLAIYNGISTSITTGNFEELQNYLQENGANTILNLLSDKGRTPLHDACDCLKKRTSTRMVAEILDWYRRNGGDDNNHFLNKQDNQKNTALHYAAKNKNRIVVESLLRFGVDVNLSNLAGREGICLIYEHVPEVMISLMRDGDFIRFIEKTDDPTEEEWQIECNFCLITGIGNSPTEIFETYMLSNVFNLEKETQAEILNNPIVQLFLDLKWTKMKYIIYFMMIAHILWSVFTVTHIMAVFQTKYANRTGNRTEPMGNPYFQGACIFPSVILFTIAFIIMIKETVEILSSIKIKTYYMEAENVGQWVLILLTFLILSIGWMPNVPEWVDFTMSLAAVFIACLLIIGQMTYFPSLGIYMEILMKVSKNFSKFLLSFCPIIFAFACVFSMLMPAKPEFFLWPPWGIPKIVAMMTGEIDFNEIFQDDKFSIMFTKNVALLVFLTIVTLVLHNLLIGLVVSDMEGLEKEAKQNSIRTQLEQLYLVEAFIVSLGKVLRYFCIPNQLEESIMITQNGKHIVTKDMKDFSPEIQRDVLKERQQTAEKNLVVQLSELCDSS
ncbi:unnamed protein product [Orchesella dallaii]|uniref:Transient receptor potential channel pyrexia n=1 Tax=Orchesella dallaii TaxID=48710 RepID=A0ABP1QG83_9HEXA